MDRLALWNEIGRIMKDGSLRVPPFDLSDLRHPTYLSDRVAALKYALEVMKRRDLADKDA